MRVEFDADANALYVCVFEGSASRTVELTDTVLVDLDASGAVLGVEVISPGPITAPQRRPAPPVGDTPTP